MPLLDRRYEAYLRPFCPDVCLSPLCTGFIVHPCVAVIGALNIMGCGGGPSYLTWIVYRPHTGPGARAGVPCYMIHLF